MIQVLAAMTALAVFAQQMGGEKLSPALRARINAAAQQYLPQEGEDATELEHLRAEVARLKVAANEWAGREIATREKLERMIVENHRLRDDLAAARSPK